MQEKEDSFCYLKRVFFFRKEIFIHKKNIRRYFGKKKKKYYKKMVMDIEYITTNTESRHCYLAVTSGPPNNIACLPLMYFI